MSERQHGTYAAPAQAYPRNGLGIAALVTGIIGILFGLVPITFFIAGPLAVISIILGFAGRGRVKRGIATNGKATVAGIVCGFVAGVLSVIGFATVIDAFEDLGDELESTADDGAGLESGGSEPVTNSGNTANPPTEDVTVDGCDVDEFGFVTAPLTIINHSSEASSYFITVEVTDADGVRIGEAYASADALRPDQTAETDAVGLDDLSDAGDVSCTLLRVERLNAEN